MFCWAYSDEVNNGEHTDRPAGDRTAELRSGTRRGRHARETRYESKAAFLTVATLALLAGIFLSWLLLPTPEEQLSAARAETERRDRTIAELQGQIRELQAVLDRVDPSMRNIAVTEQTFVERQADLDAQSRALADREAVLAQREQALANRWSVPKPSGPQLVAFFKNLSDSIGRALNGEGALERATCQC
jgi:hypothetical protein